MTPRGLVYEHSNPMTLKRLGLVLAEDGEGLVGHVRDAQTARDLRDFLGYKAQRRIATVRRVTKETEITLSVDLDREAPRSRPATPSLITCSSRSRAMAASR